MAVLDPVKLRARPTGPRSSAARRTASPATRRCIRSGPSSARATSRSAPSSGSSATTSPRCRRRASSASIPGNKVRLKYGYVVECTGCEKDADGDVTAVLATHRARHQERHAGRRRGQGQGHDHLGRRRTTRCRPKCACTTACSPTPQPDAGGKDFKASLNPRQQAGRRAAIVEPSLGAARSRTIAFQFERHGYFVADRVDHARRPAGLQPHHDAARHLVALGRGVALTSAARSFQSRVRRGWKRTPCCSRRIVPGPESRHEPSSSFPPPPDACAPLRRRHVPTRVAPRRNERGRHGSPCRRSRTRRPPRPPARSSPTSRCVKAPARARRRPTRCASTTAARW